MSTRFIVWICPDIPAAAHHKFDTFQSVHDSFDFIVSFSKNIVMIVYGYKFEIVTITKLIETIFKFGGRCGMNFEYSIHFILPIAFWFKN